MITTLMNQESPCCCQTSCLWLDNGQCVSVCAQNVSGMVSEHSRVEGTRYRCPWGQSPPAHSAQTRRLHLQPVHSPPGPILSLQPRTDLEQRGVQPVVRAERGGNDWRLTGGRTGRVWRETFGSNKSIRALFSSVRVWVSCNGQSGLLAGQVCPDTLHLPVTTNSCASISEVRSTQKSCLCKFWRFFYKRVPR